MTVMQRLTVTDLRRNKGRSVMTICGIALSVALITVVACLMASIRHTAADYSVMQSGNFDYILIGPFEEEDVSKIALNRDVQGVYTVSEMGAAQFASNNQYHNWLSVVGMNREAYTDCFAFSLSEGTLPQNEGEVLITPAFRRYSEKEYRVGDTIEVDLGWFYTKDIDGTRYYNIPAEGIWRWESAEFEKTSRRTYTVCGIASEFSGELAEGSDTGTGRQQLPTLFTVSGFSGKASIKPDEDVYIPMLRRIYLKLTDEGAQNHIQVMAGLTGLTEDQVKRFVEYNAMSEEEFQLVNATLEKNSYHIRAVIINHWGRLESSGSDESNRLVFCLVAVIIGVIILSSVYIIRNSFAISVTEKTKLYGMLSSIGATPRQVRQNVLFEGFLLGLFGVPAGILLGMGIAYGLTAVSNTILSDSLFGVHIAFTVSVEAIVLAVILAFATIFLSCYVPAQEASKIPPIEAIRSNRDIKRNKKTETYKTPALITRLFGVGGSIAWKNLRRSRRQYRTTVISIIVSIVLFITISSVVDVMTEVVRQQFGDIDCELIYYGAEYDSVTEADEEDPSLTYETMRLNVEKTVELWERIAGMDGVEKARYSFRAANYHYTIPESALASDLKDYQCTYVYDHFDGKAEVTVGDASVYGVNRETFDELLKKSGADPDSVKNGVILLNRNMGIGADSSDRPFGRFLQDPVGTTITLEENDTGDKIPLTIAAEVSDLTYLRNLEMSSFSAYGMLVMPMDTFRKTFSLDHIREMNLQIHSIHPDETADAIEEMLLANGREDTDSLINYDRLKRMLEAQVLMAEIFIYGFIVIISLIGITNIFNTITNNLRRRQKEFAMLQSIGMTGKEFHLMITLESLFYTSKSLLIGLPIGLGGSFLLYQMIASVNIGIEIPYVFPAKAVLISVLAVLIVIWVIMSFSIRRVHSQNVIETIRKDSQ